MAIFLNKKNLLLERLGSLKSFESVIGLKLIIHYFINFSPNSASSDGQNYKTFKFIFKLLRQVYYRLR